MFEFLFIDIDGVMTNGKKIYDNKHRAIYKEFNDKDFTAIDLFKTFGIRVFLLTGDKNINVEMANKRKIDIIVTQKWLKVKNFDFNNCEKLQKIKEICFDLDKVAYVGDDWFDIPVLKEVGFPFCPFDSPLYVQKYATVLQRKGGDGVVAEIFEKMIYEKNNCLWK